MKWHTEVRKISELKGWKDNPRTISKEAYSELKSSIEDLGSFEPLVVDTDGTVIAGNQRLKVHVERGDEEVEVSVPERKLKEKEIKKIGLISNRHSGEWDMDKLAEEFEDVIEELGFSDLMSDLMGGDLYTAKVEVPTYEPSGIVPDIGDMVSEDKVKELIKLVDSSDVDEKVKVFLRIASTRFYKYDYSKIADFYAGGDKEVQELMEKLALVIVDYDKAIENGFVDFVSDIMEEQEEEYGKE